MTVGFKYFGKEGEKHVKVLGVGVFLLALFQERAGHERE